MQKKQQTVGLGRIQNFYTRNVTRNRDETDIGDGGLTAQAPKSLWKPSTTYGNKKIDPILKGRAPGNTEQKKLTLAMEGDGSGTKSPWKPPTTYTTRNTNRSGVKVLCSF